MIQKGYNLIDKISDNDDFLEEWDGEYSPIGVLAPKSKVDMAFN